MNSIVYHSVQKETALLLERESLSNEASYIASSCISLMAPMVRGLTTRLSCSGFKANGDLFLQTEGAESISYIESTPIHEESVGCLRLEPSYESIYPQSDYCNQRKHIGGIL